MIKEYSFIDLFNQFIKKSKTLYEYIQFATKFMFSITRLTIDFLDSRVTNCFIFVSY